MSPVAVVLPGRAYPVTMPALAAVVDVLDRSGYDVRAVEWVLSAPPDDPAGFVEHRLAAAAPDGCDLVVGKSLGCWAGARAAAQRLPAVWITPVLTDPPCAAGIRANPAPQLVVAGLADPMHDRSVARTLGCDLLELPGLDHALSATGDGVVAPVDLEQMSAAVDAFVASLPGALS